MDKQSICNSFEVIVSKTKETKGVYQSPKFNAKKLATLVRLRKDVGLSQRQVAEYFGMKRWDSVGAWETGINKPHTTKRLRFINYLINKLSLSYEELYRLWDGVMVGEWGWDPLRSSEVTTFFPGKTSQFVRPEVDHPPLILPTNIPHFTGRDVELDQILANLFPGKIVTLFGPGGVGKTALAIEVIQRLFPDGGPSDRFPDGIIWHDFYREPKVSVILEKIARAFGEDLRPTPMASVQRVLSKRYTLLVLDGVENADDAPSILSIHGKCGVLMTSRKKEDVVDIGLSITPLPQVEAIKVLQAWGGGWALDDAVIAQISELVGRLPLAIRIVGAYMASTQQYAYEYLAWLKANPLQALDHGRLREQSISLLLENSFNQVSEISRLTLSIIGQLALAPFDVKVIAAALDIPPAIVGPRYLGELVNYGLLARIGQTYQVSHNLIYSYAQLRMIAPSEVINRLANYYIRFVESQHRFGGENYGKLDLERPHIVTIIKSCNERRDWEIAHRLAWTIDDYLNIRGHWTERIVTLKSALVATRKLKYRASEGNALGNLGTVYYHLGEAEKAIKYYERAFTIARSIANSYDECAWLGNLGASYYDLGEMEKAIEYYEKALTLSQKMGNLQEEGTNLSNLGTTYFALGETKKAIQYYEKGLAISRENGHRQGISTCLGNLGAIYYDTGQLKKAMSYYQQALIIDRQIGDRRGEGIWLHNIGEIYKEYGEISQARQYLQEALVIFEEIKAPFSDDTHRLLVDLSNS